MVTVELTQTEIDSIDESRNRLNIVTLARNTGKIRTHVNSDSVCNQKDIDTSDKSRSRIHKSALGVVLNSERELLKLTDDDTEVTRHENLNS